MKYALKWAVATLTLAVLAVGAGFTKAGAPKEPNSVALLNESYNLINQIDDSRQAFFLLSLTRVGAKLSAPREEDWCMKMFRQSLKVQEPWDRVALEKNALVALSAVNAQAAMDLFWRVEEPAPDANDKYPEDVRADAASQIFPNYFDHQMKLAAAEGNAESRLQATLSDIRREAARIGRTGEYPYRASSKIIQKLEVLKDHEAEINEMFGEAVKAYSGGKPKFRNRNGEFLVLLQNAKPAVSDASLYREAVDVFVQTVKASQDDVNYEAHFRTPEGTTIRFTNRSRAILFNAFPIIREVDPQLAKSLIEEYSEFAQATDNMTYVSAGVIEGNVTPQQATSMHSRMQQISLLALIQLQQQTDPLAAKQLAESLPDAQIRFVGLSSALPGLTRDYPSTAKAVYDDQRTQLQEFTGDAEKGQALVALAKSAAYVKDEDGFRAFSGSAFDLLVGVYNQDYRQRPDLRPDLHKGYNDLRDIVRFTASRNPAMIVDRIRQVQDGELKAHLLIHAAEGLSEHD